MGLDSMSPGITRAKGKCVLRPARRTRTEPQTLHNEHDVHGIVSDAGSSFICAAICERKGGDHHRNRRRECPCTWVEFCRAFGLTSTIACKARDNNAWI